MLGARARVALARRARKLAFELSVAVQACLRSAGRRRSRRAPRSPVRPRAAVAEPARRREVDDVIERGLDAFARHRGPRAPGCPGVSTSSDPPGSSNSSRWVVVWRPRESDSRTSAVFWRSSPSRALTSVDLPTPDEPEDRRRGARRRCARNVVEPGAGVGRDRDDRDARSDRIDRHEPSIDVVREVGLVEDDDRA